jgi:hypothetical protein
MDATTSSLYILITSEVKQRIHAGQHPVNSVFQKCFHYLLLSEYPFIKSQLTITQHQTLQWHLGVWLTSDGQSLVINTPILTELLKLRDPKFIDNLFHHADMRPIPDDLRYHAVFSTWVNLYLNILLKTTVDTLTVRIIPTAFQRVFQNIRNNPYSTQLSDYINYIANLHLESDFSHNLYNQLSDYSAPMLYIGNTFLPFTIPSGTIYKYDDTATHQLVYWDTPPSIPQPIPPSMKTPLSEYTWNLPPLPDAISYQTGKPIYPQPPMKATRPPPSRPEPKRKPKPYFFPSSDDSPPPPDTYPY